MGLPGSIVATSNFLRVNRGLDQSMRKYFNMHTHTLVNHFKYSHLAHEVQESSRPFVGIKREQREVVPEGN
jgi:hypothetical protein